MIHISTSKVCVTLMSAKEMPCVIFKGLLAVHNNMYTALILNFSNYKISLAYWSKSGPGSLEFSRYKKQSSDERKKTWPFVSVLRLTNCKSETILPKDYVVSWVLNLAKWCLIFELEAKFYFMSNMNLARVKSTWAVLCKIWSLKARCVLL